MQTDWRRKWQDAFRPVFYDYLLGPDSFHRSNSSLVAKLVRCYNWLNILSDSQDKKCLRHCKDRLRGNGIDARILHQMYGFVTSATAPVARVCYGGAIWGKRDQSCSYPTTVYYRATTRDPPTPLDHQPQTDCKTSTHLI